MSERQLCVSAVYDHRQIMVKFRRAMLSQLPERVDIVSPHSCSKIQWKK
jgi:hypothetical protein